jgi:hypothetical protein
LEIATDLTLLHPEVKIGVLRGSPVNHLKYQGQRVFSSGINLTRIYQGKQSYLSFLFRSMGLHNKLYRGVLVENEPDRIDAPIEEPERTLEKLWIAAVDKFAIGGGCQLLLVVDYVIAEAGSYFNLPARKEGFLPSAANMRLPRFIGEQLAREAILFDRMFYADTPEGRLPRLLLNRCSPVWILRLTTCTAPLQEPFCHEPIGSLTQSLLEKCYESYRNHSGGRGKYASCDRCFSRPAFRQCISCTGEQHSTRSHGLQPRRSLLARTW